MSRLSMSSDESLPGSSEHTQFNLIGESVPAEKISVVASFGINSIDESVPVLKQYHITALG